MKRQKLPTVKWMMDRFALNDLMYVRPRIVKDGRRHLFLADILKRGKIVNQLCPIPITKEMIEQFNKEVNDEVH